MRLFLLLLSVSVLSFGQSQGLRFIQNKGQWNKLIDFQAQVPGGRLAVSATGFSVLLFDEDELERRHLSGHGAIQESDGQGADSPIQGHYFQINLLGANTNAKVETGSAMDGYYNYFLGNDTSRWAEHALAFSSITYRDVYEGIDFHISSVGKNLKYDFVVKPGADPGQIKLEYQGVGGIEKSDGGLEIQTAVGALRELKPYSYQTTGSVRQTVASELALTGNVVSFSFPAGYNEREQMTIDPLLIFSTYSGSTADNWGSTATPGEHGTLYSAGVTHQGDGGFFPATTGAFQTTNKGKFDMAIIKYDSVGSRFLFATYLGGKENDSPESLVVDKATGDLLVLGVSSSPDYPTGLNSYDQLFNGGSDIFNRVLNTTDRWDIVITRLSPNGSQLVGSTFLGGSGNDGLNQPKPLGGPLVANYGDEMRGDIITDGAGNVYISSVTASNNFPIVNGFDPSFNGGVTDGVIVKLLPDLSSIVWSSFLGGSGFDAAYSIKFDNNGDVMVAGGTSSLNFPTTTGSYQTAFNGIVDGWIARIAADGSALLNATLTGTPSFDQIYFIDLNANGNVFCYGQTAGHMPITAGVYNNVNSGQFLQKFSADLKTLQFSTVFGSGSSNGLVTPNISPTAFLVNDCDNIYMAGWGGFVNSSIQTGFWQSSTIGMPITGDAYQKTTSGSDFYFIVLNSDATKLVYSTYLGGSLSKTHVDGGTSRFDKYGIVYHSVCAGCAFGNVTNLATSDFPTTAQARSRVNGSVNCNNAAFKFDLSSLKAMFQTNSVDLMKPGFNNVCYPDKIVFQNVSTGGKNIVWNFDDGTIINQTDTDSKNITHQFKKAGQYRVKLKIVDLSTCTQTDSTTQVINYFKENIVVGDDATICDGKTFQLTAAGGVSYQWTNKEGTFSSSLQNPVVQPTRETIYFVTVTDGNSCSRKDTLKVSVTPNVRASFQTYAPDFSLPGYNQVCYPNSILFKNKSLNGESYVWDFADGTLLPKAKTDTTSAVHLFKQAGVYQVKLKAMNAKTCNKADSVIKTIYAYREAITVNDDGEICEGSSFQLNATGGNTYQWSADDQSLRSSDSSPVVRPQHTTNYFVTGTDSHGCVGKDTVKVTVVEQVDLNWQHTIQGHCNELPTVVVQNLTPPANEVTFLFDFGDGTTAGETAVDHVYNKEGAYTLKFIAQRKFCTFEEKVEIPIYRLLIPNIFTPDESPGYNDYFEIGFAGSGIVPPSQIGLPVELTIVDRWGKTIFESSDYRNDWNANSLPGGVYFVHVKIGDLARCKNWVHVLK